MDSQPLLTWVKQNEAEMRAAIRSITSESTGLGPRSHRRLIKLLETIACDGFSDGVKTTARNGVLADRMNVDRSTVKRSVADGRRCGLLESNERTGDVGQQLGSERVICWPKVEELIGRKLSFLSRSTTAPPPAQLRHPRRNCATPGATAPPSRTYRTDNTDSKSDRNPETKSDQMNNDLERALPLAVSACKALGPRAKNDRQLIARAALLAVTKLSEQWLASAIRGVAATKTRRPMANFQTICRERCKAISGEDFDGLAGRLSIPRQFYSRLDAALRPPTPAATLRTADIPPRRSMAERKNAFERQLARIAGQ